MLSSNAALILRGLLVWQSWHCWPMGDRMSASFSMAQCENVKKSDFLTMVTNGDAGA